MPTVTLILLEPALASSLTLPAEMLNAAHDIRRAHRRATDRLHLQLVTPEYRRTHATASGLSLRATHTLKQARPAELILLPALWRNPRRALHRYPALVPWLRTQHDQGNRLCAVGTSSRFLAQSGLLNHRPATTHWHDFDAFASDYPDVHLQRHHLITHSGRLYCAASINAVADLMIYFIRELYDSTTARAVERHFSPEIRSPYEAGLFSSESRQTHHDEQVVRAQEWLRRHHAEPVRMDRLARELGFSIRTLDRRFRQATGLTPRAYLKRCRIEAARDMLRHSNLGIGEVAEHCGFSHPSYFAACFREHMHQTPGEYRKAVRGKLFTVQS